MLMSLRLNPEYSGLLPKMSDEEFAELKASIKAEGQHYPIIVNEDLEVLDGHHRYQACIELGIEPDFEVRRFDDKLLEKKFVIEANLRRRHLNNFQLVELAVPLLEIEKALAKKRKAKGSKDDGDLLMGTAQEDIEPEFKSKANEVVARKAGVSTRTFEKGKKILEAASEEEKQRLREGKASITKVYSEIKSSENALLGKEIPTTIQKPLSPREIQNMAKLQSFLELLQKDELFCPSCGNATFACSRCHKTLQELLKSKNISDNSA
jgi:ParB-like chromosome segregation protein Spo0J